MNKTTILAVAAMWLLGSLGVWLLVNEQEWIFLMTPEMPLNLRFAQAVGFYAALCGAKIPGASVAGLIMATNHSATYLRTALTIFGFQTTLLALRGITYPGSDILGDFGMVFALEVVSAIVLSLFGTIAYWGGNSLIKDNNTSKRTASTRSA